jgi:hypothetical protein
MSYPPQQIYAIRDTFHGRAHPGYNRWISSNRFDTPQDFFDWCKQHDADQQWHEIAYAVKPETAALIRITSTEGLGNDNLTMWVGYPHLVDFDDGKVDLDLVLVENASQYQYKDLDISYRYGKADQIPSPEGCPNKESDCYCTGACRTDPPEALQIDQRYFDKTKK